MKVFSDACEHAIRAVVYLAQRPEQRHTVRDIAQATHVSAGYLAKTLQTLVKVGLLEAHRGTRGGYTLGREAAAITLRDIVLAIEPPHRREPCPMGHQRANGCDCAVHQFIDEAVSVLERRFDAATIAQMTHVQREVSQHARLRP